MGKRAQIIEVEDRNPFGDENVSEEAMQNIDQRDIFYIPGYSDKRTQYEKMTADGYAPKALPFRLQFVRAQTAAGAADGSKLAEWKSKGYKVLSWDEAKKLGLEVDDTACHKAEDGSIMNGDSLLMIADKSTAATNYAQWQRDTKDQHEARVMGPLRESAEEVNAKMGHDTVKGTEFDQEIVTPATHKKKVKK